MEQVRTRDWVLSKVAVIEGAGGSAAARPAARDRLGHVAGIAGMDEGQGATHLLAAFESMKPADLAGACTNCRRSAGPRSPPRCEDERLADVLEELPEEDQVEILGALDAERAADVLEEMSPDDAADLIAELAPE